MPDMARFSCFENLLCQVDAFFAIAVMVVVRARRWVVVVARRSPSVDALRLKDSPVNSPSPSLRAGQKTFVKKLLPLLDLCVSSLRRGHANLLCIVPILTDDPRRESKVWLR